MSINLILITFLLSITAIITKFLWDINQLSKSIRGNTSSNSNPEKSKD
jgi:hypothetical protein